jgi:hypothetical protein
MINGTPGQPLRSSFFSDGLVLWHLMRGRRGVADEDHASSLQRFYAPQAEHYDHFRERLLQGRRELIERLAPQPGNTVVELGGGTGRNLEFFGVSMWSTSAPPCSMSRASAAMHGPVWPAPSRPTRHSTSRSGRSIAFISPIP